MDRGLVPGPPPQRSPQSQPAATFDDFYRAQYAGVVAYVMLLDRDRDRAGAEDVTQAAMLALWRSWAQIEYPATWVRIVAKRDFLKIATARRAREPGPATEEDRDPRAEDAYAEVEVRQWLRDASSQLPSEQARVLTLACEGLRPHEIAEVLDKNPATTRSHLRLARQAIRRMNEEPPRAPTQRPEKKGV